MFRNLSFIVFALTFIYIVDHCHTESDDTNLTVKNDTDRWTVQYQGKRAAYLIIVVIVSVLAPTIIIHFMSQRAVNLLSISKEFSKLQLAEALLKQNDEKVKEMEVINVPKPINIPNEKTLTKSNSNFLNSAMKQRSLRKVKTENIKPLIPPLKSGITNDDSQALTVKKSTEPEVVSLPIEKSAKVIEKIMGSELNSQLSSDTKSSSITDAPSSSPAPKFITVEKSNPAIKPAKIQEKDYIFNMDDFVPNGTESLEFKTVKSLPSQEKPTLADTVKEAKK